MGRFLMLRLLAVVPILLLVTFVVMLLLDLAPGDPASVVAGETATAEQVASVRARLGLDRPVAQRYLEYIGKVARGDLGDSLFANRSVADAIRATLPVTASLASASLVLAVVIGVPIGAAAALRPRRLLDRGVTAATAVALAVPPFVLGLVLVTTLSVSHTLFPAVGYVAPTADPAQWLRHIALPAFALSIAPAAELARQTRGAFADVLERDYVRAAEAKGLSRVSVICKHGAKNAASPIVTVFGLQIGRVLGGAVVVEQVFAIPGFGTMALRAMTNKDYPLIQGIVLISGLVVAATNFLVDVLYGYLNPRVRT